ncbi:MAG: radical SAM protein [Candidatus Thorarchaeota archaeon]
MKREIIDLESDSLLLGDLPQGCSLCTKGSKMVLFVTGLCDSSCFYCPLSSDKSGKDVVFANEMPVELDDNILYESDAIGGEGAGISGGDPLCQLERTIRYIRLLKGHHGSDFHIHLYTSESDIDTQVLSDLQDAGLDEIRFHPQSEDWSGIENAIRLGMNVGIEIPVIPGDIEALKATARRAEEIGVGFVNINELEASETNFSRLTALGMRLTDLASASIEGSADTAQELMNWATENLESLTIHFCSARFKDAVQMRNRLERRLERTIREFEERDDDDPLLVVGLIRARHGFTFNTTQLETIYDVLRDEFEVPSEMMNLDDSRMRIEIAPWILDEIADAIKLELIHIENLEMGIAFEYPSWDRLQTMFNPL